VLLYASNRGLTSTPRGSSLTSIGFDGKVFVEAELKSRPLGSFALAGAIEMPGRLEALMFILCSLPSGGALGTESETSPRAGPPEFEVMRGFWLRDATFRSVAIRAPWVYVLDRSGKLFWFDASNTPDPGEIETRAFRPNAGDGHDLKLVGDVLLCTRKGALEAYSIKESATPKRLGRFGEAARDPYASVSLVVERSLAFVIGKNVIGVYDVSVPGRPKFLARLQSGRFGVNAVASGMFLYVGVGPSAKTDQPGIAVYDISNPSLLKEVGFKPTGAIPYHLFTLGSGRVLAMQDGGKSSLFDISKPDKPVLVKSFDRCGGRAAAVFHRRDENFVLCNGGVYSASGNSLERCFSFPRGHLLDGAPYHGSCDGNYACLATDNKVVVLRVEESAERPKSDTRK
jgi:hypothetical protein